MFLLRSDFKMLIAPERIVIFLKDHYTHANHTKKKKRKKKQQTNKQTKKKRHSKSREDEITPVRKDVKTKTATRKVCRNKYALLWCPVCAIKSFREKTEEMPYKKTK